MESPPALGVKIYNQYGQNVYHVVKENPYRLADDINGVGFRIADEIASRVGIHTDSDFRVRSGILYVLLQACGEGHVYLPGRDFDPEGRRAFGSQPTGSGEACDGSGG